MRIDGRISCRTRHVLVLPVLDVLASARILVLPSQAKIDDVNEFSALSQTHQKVVGLYVAVNQIFAVDVFYAGYLQAKKKVAINIQKYFEGNKFIIHFADPNWSQQNETILITCKSLIRSLFMYPSSILFPNASPWIYDPKNPHYPKFFHPRT